MSFKMPQMYGASFSKNEEYLDVRCRDQEIEATSQMGYFQWHHLSLRSLPHPGCDRPRPGRLRKKSARGVKDILDQIGNVC